jgi:hypothetical protein
LAFLSAYLACFDRFGVGKGRAAGGATVVYIGEVTVIEEGGVTDGGGAITRSIGLT